MSVGHLTESIWRLPQQRSVDGRHWTLVLHGRHVVRELVGQRILSVEVGTIQRHGAGRLRHRAAAAKELRWVR